MKSRVLSTFSSDTHKEYPAIRPTLVAQGVRRRRAALAEIPPRRRLGHAAPGLVAEVPRRDLALHRRERQRVAIFAEVELEELARPVVGAAWSDATAVREGPRRTVSVDAELPVSPGAGWLVLLGDREPLAVEHENPVAPIFWKVLRGRGAAVGVHRPDAVEIRAPI